MDTFKVGDAVVITRYRNGSEEILAVSKVARVLKTKVVLENEEEWEPSGNRRKRDRDPWFRGPTMRLREARDEDLIRRQNALRKIQKVDWTKLATETLLCVQGIVEGSGQ